MHVRSSLALSMSLGCLAWSVLVATPAHASSSSCGFSGGHTVCITVPGGTLSGDVRVQVTNSPNSGLVYFTWVPINETRTYLMTDFAPSPGSGDYSFTWPTQKYLDASGTLQVRAETSSATPIGVNTTIVNGNSGSIAPSNQNPNDWQKYLPGSYYDLSDPVIPAVGDGASDEVNSGRVADFIDGITPRPPIFLFLGDIYEKGTFTENVNHYGVSSLDDPVGATQWGRFADITQPVVGNHEKPNLPAWTDYWHQHKPYYSFDFGGVRFIGLNSSSSMSTTSKQYAFVQDSLAGAPRCIVSFWHIPVIKAGGTPISRILPIWSLLADNGGDLVLNGHVHNMQESVPLDDNLNPGGHMVELISGAGGHSLGGGKTDFRFDWAKGKTPGAVLLTLNGAAQGGVATSIGWQYVDTSGNVLHTGSITC